jgi:hypothetical protein
VEVWGVVEVVEVVFFAVGSFWIRQQESSGNSYVKSWEREREW